MDFDRNIRALIEQVIMVRLFEAQFSLSFTVFHNSTYASAWVIRASNWPETRMPLFATHLK